MVAELDAHRFITPSIIATHVLPLAGAVALVQRGEQPDREMQPVPVSPICAPVTNGGPSGTRWCSSRRPFACATFS